MQSAIGSELYKNSCYPNQHTAQNKCQGRQEQNELPEGMGLAADLGLWSLKIPQEHYLQELLLTLPFSSLILWLPTIPQCSNISLIHYQGLSDYYHCLFALLLLNWPCINDRWIVSQKRVCSLLMFSRWYTTELLLEQLIIVIYPFFGGW